MSNEELTAKLNEENNEEVELSDEAITEVTGGTTIRYPMRRHKFKVGEWLDLKGDFDPCSGSGIRPAHVVVEVLEAPDLKITTYYYNFVARSVVSIETHIISSYRVKNITKPPYWLGSV